LLLAGEIIELGDINRFFERGFRGDACNNYLALL